MRENRLKKNNNNKAGKNRMNFEIIDNIFQVIVFSLIIVADIVCWFLHKNRLYIILALAHSCFMMGTLYFVLYLVIRERYHSFLCIRDFLDCQLFVSAFVSDCRI